MSSGLHVVAMASPTKHERASSCRAWCFKLLALIPRSPPTGAYCTRRGPAGQGANRARAPSPVARGGRRAGQRGRVSGRAARLSG